MNQTGLPCQILAVALGSPASISARNARQILVNGGDLRHVVDEAVKSCVDQAASRRRLEKLFQLAAMYINTELHGVVACCVRQIVLVLESLSD